MTAEKEQIWIMYLLLRVFKTNICLANFIIALKLYKNLDYYALYLASIAII